MSERPIRASRRFLEVEHPHIAEKIDFADVVRLQMDRCLQSAEDEVAFAANVKALEALIPATDITDEYLEEVEECIERVQYETPATCCGVPVNPEAIQSKIEEVTEVDWHGRFQAAINLFTGMGITWRRVPTTAF